MPKPECQWVTILISVCAGLLLVSCGSMNVLQIHYRLPVSAVQFQGKQLLLSVKDARENDRFLTPAARTEYRNFSGDFTLTAVDEKGMEYLLGVFDTRSMLEQTFIQRFTKQGIDVKLSDKQIEPMLSIVLNQFELDYVDRKWVVRMEYTANLQVGDKGVGSETVSGSAERLKIKGTGDAEKVIGELLTDMANKLNLARLYQEAGM